MAVSRARNKIILVTSIPVDDVSDMLSSHSKPAKPRDYLQGYLQYAQLDGFVKLEVLFGEGEHDLYESGYVGLPHIAYT